MVALSDCRKTIGELKSERAPSFLLHQNAMSTHNRKRSSENNDHESPPSKRQRLNPLGKLMAKLRQLSDDSNITFSSESDDNLNPLYLKNDGKIIVKKSTIVSHIVDAKCVLSSIPGLCDEIAGFLVDDNKYSTEQFLSMLFLDSNLKSESNKLDDFRLGLSIWSGDNSKENVSDFMTSQNMVDLVQHFRVPLTLENAKIMSAIEQEEGEEAFSWKWIDFMNENLADCSIMRVPADIFMAKGLAKPQRYNWNCHQNFIVGRSANGDLCGFCGFVVWT